MSRGLFQKISGAGGEVWIKALGAKIGTISQWQLSLQVKDEGSGDSNGLYDLRAVFSHLNQYLWEDEDYEKEIIVVLGKTKRFRVQKASDVATVLVGRTLLMKGVSIHVAD